MMHGREKSDSAIVAVKPTNKAVPTAAEPVEPRAGAKGNARQQSTHRTQGRERVTQATEAEIAALDDNAKAVAQSAKASIDAEQGNAARHLADALNYLEAIQAHLSGSLKTADAAFDASVKKILIEAR